MSFSKHSGERRLEFGGVIGATSLVFVLPTTIMAINIACNKVFISMHIGIIGHIYVSMFDCLLPS